MHLTAKQKMKVEFTLLLACSTVFYSTASGIYYETIMETMENNETGADNEFGGDGSTGLLVDKSTSDTNKGDQRMQTIRNRAVSVAMGLQFLQELWPFGFPIFHLSIILPKREPKKPGTEVMLTLEYTKRNGPAFALKTFTNLVPHTDIIYYLNNKWFFKDWRHTCSTAVYFEGEKMQTIVPAQLAKELGQIYDDISQKYGLLDKSSLEGICRGMQQQIVGIPQFVGNLSQKWAPLLTAIVDNAAEALLPGKDLTGEESCQAKAACNFVGQVQLSRRIKFPQLSLQHKEPLKPLTGPSNFERRHLLRKVPTLN